jgi:signal transduction histidine kinase
MTALLTIAIKYEQDVVAVRQRARQIAARLGFDGPDQVRIATAVSEIARNAFGYAKGGKVEFHVDQQSRPQALMVRVTDEGPGIPALQAVLEGRYTSQTGMGLGIVGARRLMDECVIHSGPGKGTQVELIKRLPAAAPLVTASSLARVVDELVAHPAQTGYDEVQQQNQELLRALQEVRERQQELLHVNRELEDTNRGVVALYAELDENADSLRRADESKTRFLSNMGHEFRTPLNSIRGLTRLLLDHMDGPLSDEQEKQVRLIRKASEDLSTMVDDLLDLAKIEAGRVEVHPTSFTINDLFSTLRGMLRPLLVAESVRLIFEEGDRDYTLHTDEGKLSQILRNFVSNALKFTERGEVRVTAAPMDDEGAIAFFVSDTGIGIAPEDQERVFEEFTQIENPLQKRIKGTGLGLPLCRRLASLLGGRVELKSEAGIGSTFAAIIPVRYRDAEQARAEIPLAPPQLSLLAGDSPVEPATVLIIDDEAPARYFLAKLLAQCAVRVHEAGDGFAGLESARAKPPDLIFLDVRMPGQSGAEVLLDLKADPATAAIPVVVMSSLSLEEIGQYDFQAAAAIVRKDQLSTESVRGLLMQASIPCER